MSNSRYGIENQEFDEPGPDRVDFNNVTACRKFMRDIRCSDGAPLDTVTVRGKGDVSVHTLNDLEVCYYAFQIFKDKILSGQWFLEETVIH